jgi:hypothetical protein
VHQNAMRALRALGDPMTSTRHGLGGVHRGSCRFLLLGKGSPCRGRPGGEMTGTGVVDCVLAKRGCPRWPWRWLGERGVLEQCHCKVEPGLGFVQGGVRLQGVEGGGWSKHRGRGRPWQDLASGYPPLPRCQTLNDKRKGFANLWTPKENP